MKHTPGPWRVNETTIPAQGGVQHWFIIEQVEENEDGNREWIVELQEDPLIREKDHANMQLMAAAPELYEEYKGLLSRVNTMAQALRNAGLGSWVNAWLSDGILDGKAIEKAEGDIPSC